MGERQERHQIDLLHPTNKKRDGDRRSIEMMDKRKTPRNKIKNVVTNTNSYTHTHTTHNTHTPHTNKVCVCLCVGVCVST